MLALAVALVFAATAGASDHKARAVSCGDTITRSIKLKADLNCNTSAADGLDIGANGVTVDLNGHSILGSGGADGYTGIEDDGFDNVTIEDGAVKGFHDDVLFTNVAKSTVDHVVLRLNDFGVYNGITSTDGSGNHFTHNVVTNANYGIYSADGGGNEIRGNLFYAPSYGVFTDSEARDTIIKNRSRGALLTNGFWSQNDYGTVYKGDVAKAGYRGFYALGPTDVTYRSVTASDNGFAGIYIDQNDPTIYGQTTAAVFDSTANDNDEWGMYAQHGVPSKGNTALGNKLHNCHLVRCNG